MNNNIKKHNLIADVVFLQDRARPLPAPLLVMMLIGCGGGGGGGSGVRPAPIVMPDTQSPAPDPAPVFIPPAPITYEALIHENFPTNKGVYDLTPDVMPDDEPDGNYALPDYGDNALFRVSADGRVWWRNEPDYENPLDANGDNVYELRITHNRNDAGETRIQVTVQDVERETTAAEWVASSNENGYISYEWFEVQPILPENDFVRFLIGSSVYAMPATGPLVLTWSLLTPDSDFDNRYLHAPDTTTQDIIDEVRDKLVRAFASFEAIANLKFIEVQDTDGIVGDIRIVAAKGYGNSGNSVSAIVPSQINIEPNISYVIYQHEIGHVLGLRHPFDEAGAFPHNPDYKRQPGLSIMTYEDTSTQVITQNDIDALQFLYGAPGTNYDGIQARFEEIGVALDIV